MCTFQTAGKCVCLCVCGVCVCVCVCVLTCFEEDNLIVLTEVHEAGDALGKLHHILDCVGDVNGTLLPHHLS